MARRQTIVHYTAHKMGGTEREEVITHIILDTSETFEWIDPVRLLPSNSNFSSETQLNSDGGMKPVRALPEVTNWLHRYIKRNTAQDDTMGIKYITRQFHYTAAQEST